MLIVTRSDSRSSSKTYPNSSGETVKQRADTAWLSWKSVPDSLKAVQLERIEGSQTFARSTQLRRLLHFLGERTIGKLAPPTEYEVAVTVLNRSESFDPRSDSLVRKEMSRLRSKLTEYYETEGKHDLVIVQNSGSYQLHFARRADAQVTSSVDPRRCLLILPVITGQADHELGELLYDELMATLGTSAKCQLVSRTSARWYAVQSRDIRHISSESGANSIVEIAIRRFQEQAVLFAWLVDGGSGHARATLRTREENGPQEMAQRIAEWLRTHGELLEDGSSHSHE
jgi:TolB-like protein